MLSVGTDTGPQSTLPLVYCPVDATLFKVGLEIHCSGVSSCYCCYGNHTAGSKPIKKLFIVVNVELNKVCLCEQNISERCELVKLWHINCSGPVVLRQTVHRIIQTSGTSLLFFNRTLHRQSTT